ncbi:MAG: MBL fold metallo-hydrolase [Bacteroidia bacterium]|nr:MBL fold metallo-hydrolase [Bacteroidia bacterium]
MNRFLVFTFFVSICFYQTKGQITSSWFSIKEIEKNVWVIDDHKAANIYLITGKDSSLVVDTGMGTADLSSLIKKLTDKPLIVVNTHGHPDHAGANFQFMKVYVHPADSLSARNCNLPERRANAAQNMLRGDTPSKEELFSGTAFNTKLIPVREGHIFNLGDRRIEVMETPGHTPGSICLLDIENKLLFSGDNNNILVWLFLQGCSPLHDYLKTLEKQKQRISEFTTLFPGHGIPIPGSFINDQIACVKGILDGTCQSKEYKSFAGDALICTSGLASVAYNPGNL